ncbi:CHAT domain-containing tetratricopeptide repeat protein [Dactylosporangium sp. AC04546]|uniref:CHAT domain-containing protein n=1 Tax=Dactylosporangium sp. AC04546 TaxID=2862460 RepID=UPI001EE0D577|nr:CHAT domain-containing tetratricopeptide repeat protein [Dactylosporangium sp. AC04546]WVK81865.1 CHAT domain-containing tetratricopeptide repeat protein [Dactylosporangium sp. AC04546]
MTAAPVLTPADDLAQRLLPIVGADPVRAKALAEAALRDAKRDGDPASEAVALRALGLAAHARHDAGRAAQLLRASIAVARKAGFSVHEAEARMSHAYVLEDLGRPTAALKEIDRALAELRGHRRARASMQRALILDRLGYDLQAMELYRSALRAFRASGDEVWEARTLTNRGVLHGYRGNLKQAESDLRQAQALYNRLGMATAAAQVEHNLGFVAAQAGDVPTALARYDRAHDRLWNTGSAAYGLLDRADLLLSVRLLPEAEAAVRAAIDACADGQLDLLFGQAHLTLARILLAVGKLQDSRTAAAAARRTFVKQGRPVWSARARLVELAAVVAAGRANRGTLRELRAAAGSLVEAGWLQPGWEGLLDAAQLAVDLRELYTARELLTEAGAAAKLGPPQLRVRWWHIRTRLELASGSVPDAVRAATAGLRQADAYRASLGATELRVRGSAETAALAGLRLRLALDHHGPSAALTWAQRCRSAALTLPPARPSTDPVVARHLTELRRIGGELAAAPTGPQRTNRLLRRQRFLEAEIRRRTWRTPGTAATSSSSSSQELPLTALASALGERVLVELLDLDGLLHALVVRGRRVTHRVVGKIEEVAAELESLRFALRSQVLGHGGTAAERLSRQVLLLDRLLLDPLADLIGTGPIVLVPTGALHALPWTMLPRLRGRSIAVAPSAAIWWRAAAQPPAPSDLVLVGAPSAAQAADEVREIASDRPGATVLAGEQARVAPALAALDGAGIGHIASHGEFRVDNPLFSFLMLADGQLTVYDLTALRRPPALLVLSGCDTGLAAVHPGDELMGLVAALLNMGTATVVASTGPVDDGATRVLMRAFYGHLAAGHRPASALALAQAEAAPQDRPSTDSFVCFGAG